ncbi:hypothetical protein LCGC14_3150460 [marine sediment metagenome]|uniref:Uncharacterized protein n=1 Tax=marine sediment metagenome TaxID=412755 RepID=A0A0F8YIM4_9ZZZZ
MNPSDTSGLINLKNQLQLIPDEFFAATLKQAELHTALEEFINANADEFSFYPPDKE